MYTKTSNFTEDCTALGKPCSRKGNISMKRFIAAASALAVMLSGANFAAAQDDIGKLTQSVPYTVTELTADDFGMEELYTDNTFTVSTETVKVDKYGDIVYGKAGDTKFEITPIISYVPEKDSPNYYFDFDESLETSPNGGYNRIIADNVSEESPVAYRHDDGGTQLDVGSKVPGDRNSTTPEGNLNDSSYTPGVLYSLEKPVTLKWNKNWSIEMKLRQRAKTSGIFYSGANCSIVSFDWHLQMYAGTPVRQNLNSKNLANVYNDVVIKNVYDADTDTSYCTALAATSSNPSATGTSANVPTNGVDFTVNKLFSAGTVQGFLGYVDYVYIKSNPDFEEAMNFVENYGELLSKPAEEADTNDIAAAVSSYRALSDNVKSELSRGEEERLNQFGRLLANGDTSIKTVCKKALDIAGGDGSEAAPYTAQLEVPYGQQKITDADIVTADEWAECSADADITEFGTKVNVKVESADKTAYYIITVYPLNISEITDADAYAFMTEYKELFKKSEVSGDDKALIEKAIEAYTALSETAKAALVRNEKGYLENLYIKCIFTDINNAKTAEELIKAAENELGVYPLNDYMAKYLISVKPKDGFSDVAEFEKLYNEAKTADLIYSGEDIEKIIENNKDFLKEDGIDISENYGALSETKRKKFAELVKNSDFANGKTLARNLRETMIMAEVRCADSASALKNAVMGTDQTGKTVNNNFEIIGASRTAYDALKDGDSAFVYMYKNISDTTVFDNLKALFESACENASQDEAKNSCSGGIGGNGGGGGSGSGSSGKSNAGIASNTAPVIPVTKNDNAAGKTFADIENHWGKNYILSLVKKNVISGYTDGTFRPDAPVTRAEFIKMLIGAFDIQGSSDRTFGDVSENDWYYDYIQKAVGAGIINGSSDGNVYPSNDISREDAAVMMYRHIKAEIKFPNKTFSFKDEEQISDYCIEAVNDMAYAGIISGKGSNKFCPKDGLTRAEAATLISNTMDYIQGGI